jgi:hypothetical protein
LRAFAKLLKRYDVNWELALMRSNGEQIKQLRCHSSSVASLTAIQRGD